MLGKDLYNWTGALSNQLVQCTGYTKEGDGAKGMTFRMSPGSAQLSSLEKLISVPTANGGWAVPTGVPTSPPRTPQVEAAEDMIRRGYTFRDQGGKDLVWEGTGRAGPLWGGTPTHRRYSKPYPITCSHFTGMLMKGWEYSSTTYVEDESYATGWFIPLGN